MSYGNYTQLHNAADDDPLNKKVRASLDGTLNELPDTFENWSPDRVKEAVKGVQANNAKRVALDQAATDFVALHPEYIDSEANGKRLNNALVARFGNRVFTVAEFEQEYQVLRANSTLQLNQAELKRQEQAAKQQRAAEARARNTQPTIEEIEQMPLEEIRRRDTMSHAERMQRLAEEGGYY